MCDSTHTHCASRRLRHAGRLVIVIPYLLHQHFIENMFFHCFQSSSMPQAKALAISLNCLCVYNLGCITLECCLIYSTVRGKKSTVCTVTLDFRVRDMNLDRKKKKKSFLNWIKLVCVFLPHCCWMWLRWLGVAGALTRMKFLLFFFLRANHKIF